MKGIRRAVAVIGAAALMATAAVGFAACDFSSFTDNGAKSAYQVAVDNGFTGTEIDWLKSLQGANGSDGRDLDIEEVYDVAVKNGYEGSFLEFLKEYLSVDVSQNNDTDVIAKNLLSVVSVYSAFRTTKQVSSGGGFGFGSGFKTKTVYTCAAGSGVIYSLNKEAGNAYIITNYHVIYNQGSENDGIADPLYVYLYGSRNGFSAQKDSAGDVVSVSDTADGIPAKVVGGAMNYDIAVLEVQGSEILRNSDAREVELGDSETVTVGEKVNVIGNPEAEGISVTSGMISVDSETISLTGVDGTNEISFRVMRTDAAVNEGNSGGGLFDVQGKLLGIVNAKNVDSAVDNMGYALPVSQVIGVVENLLRNDGSLLCARIGITIQAKESKAVYDEIYGKARIVETVAVAEVTSGYAGSGVFKAGDVLKSASLNGKTLTITRTYQLSEFMLNVRKGDTMVVTVVRDGAEKQLSMTFDRESYFVSVA